ncbi:MAG: NADH-quinone oxidoreductase subunit L [Deltaproteobacteria bacterium]|nr:NADH-quinone oxidoreductase subunit L [Deltaproteobacteria bacterium]
MNTQFFIDYAWIIPLAPLVGFLINGIGTFLKLPYVRSKTVVHTIACGALLLSFIFAVGVFLHLSSLEPEARSITRYLYTWLQVGSLKADAAFLLDPLSSVMMLIITGVGFLIHVYSIGYMADDPSYSRFFTYLNLFCFAMLLLVMGDNLLMLFIGWEGVGLCSYLLIGFWFKEKANAQAGMKAFVVNRIGDFAFLLGMFLLFWTMYDYGHASVTFKEIGQHVGLIKDVEVGGWPVLVLVGILLFIGATGKSAQVPLYVWLPDAMAGPTPVSGLIHAATMVTAGIYMIGRLNFVYTLAPEALVVVATVGAVTALFAATIGFAQNDIKKVLAYSTVSQLGYMFLGMGTGAYAAGIFHLMTHAFFKACLFLGSGSVILGMHHEQDMRKMGGLKKYMPVTYWTFLLATIAIAGIFPFSGFFSKDEILWKAFEAGGHISSWYYVLWGLGIAGAMGTAFYMFRAVSMTFYGELGARAHEVPAEEASHGHDDDHGHHGHGDHTPHESPKTMTFALSVLALLSVVGGFLGIPYALGHFFHVPNFFEHWLEPVLNHGGGHHGGHHSVPPIEYGLMIFSVAIALTASYLGYLFYTKRQDLPKKFVAKFPKLHALALNKYYVDEIYQALVVNNLLRLNNFLSAFDAKVVDGAVNAVGSVVRVYSRVMGFWDATFVDGLVNGVAQLVRQLGRALRKTQTGRIQNYLYVAMLGVVILMIWRML